jgi:tetratricopeptide (TPR) repeat protein
MQAALVILCLVAAKDEPAKSGTPLEQGAKALADFRAEDAVQLLERAKAEGPYLRADYIKLYEELGVAYAYLERNQDALQAFDMLLALDPGRAISYTLSPKVTFLFEQARGRSGDRVAPTIDVRWPLALTTSEAIPIDLEVVADPKGFLKHAKLHHRLRGAPRFDVVELDLAVTAIPNRVDLPALAVAARRPEVVELYLTAYDERGNEVYTWGSEARPREVALRFEPPEPWFEKWWVWAIAGTVVAAGASAAVFAATRTPPATVDGVLEVVP